MRSALNVTSPTPYQVFQRSGNDKADIPVAGTFRGDGVVEYRLGGSGWQRAEMQGERFSVTVKDVPVGGPYTLELRVTSGRGVPRSPTPPLSHSRIPGLLVGDLWILAGQSNMDGCGKLVNLEPPTRMVHAFYYNETWEIAADPLCRVNESIDPVHWYSEDPAEREKANRWNREHGTIGASLGVRFGKDMYKTTGVPVGLLVCSHGGTSLAQWSPERKSEGGRSLYGSMLRRVNAAGGRAAGCLWYQGESDAIGPTQGVGYKDDFRRLIESMRADFDNPGMPFIYVQLAAFFSDPAGAEGWNRVQNDQLLLEKEMPSLAMVPAIDCTLSDAIHLDAVSLRKLGARMALQAQRLRFGSEDVRTGPRPAEVAFLDGDRTRLRIRFDGVNGSLRPGRGRQGFTIEANGEPQAVKGWARDSKDPSDVIVTLTGPAPKGSVLWHGRGLSPACELRDAKGFAVPVFGPVEV